jgi:hypothetical protein
VAAADFHDVDGTAATALISDLGDENANLFEQKPRLLRISEFVDVFHVVFFLFVFVVKGLTALTLTLRLRRLMCVYKIKINLKVDSIRSGFAARCEARLCLAVKVSEGLG